MDIITSIGADTITQIIIFIMGLIMIIRTMIEIIINSIKYVRLKIANKDTTKQLQKIKSKMNKLEEQANKLIIKHKKEL